VAVAGFRQGPVRDPLQLVIRWRENVRTIDPTRPHSEGAAQAGQGRGRCALARRIPAIANALDGMSREDAAQSAGMDPDVTRLGYPL